MRFCFCIAVTFAFALRVVTRRQLLPLRCSHDASTKAKETLGAVVTRRQKRTVQLWSIDKNGRDAITKTSRPIVDLTTALTVI